MDVTRPMRFLGLLLFATFVGCSSNPLPAKTLPIEASTALRNATTFELFSLDPTRRNEESEGPAFHDWTILGSVEVPDNTTRSTLIEAIEAGVAQHREMVATCFDPRHGIRVMHDGKKHDFVICFHCYQCRWYIDDERVKGFLLSRSPQSIFDRVLRNTSITLAPPPSY